MLFLYPYYKVFSDNKLLLIDCKLFLHYSAQGNIKPATFFLL